MREGILVAIFCPRPASGMFVASLVKQEWPTVVPVDIDIPIVNTAADTREQMIWKAHQLDREYVLFWDCSIVPPPSCINVLCRLMVDHPEIAVLSAVCPSATIPPTTLADRPWNLGELLQVGVASLDMAIIRLSALDELDVPMQEHRWENTSLMCRSYFTSEPTTYTLTADPRTTMGLWEERRFAKVLGDKQWSMIATEHTICYRVDVPRKLIFNLPEKLLEEDIEACDLGAGRVTFGDYQVTNPQPGAITVDHNPEAKPDYLCDVRVLPESWTDRFARVRASHVLEHLPYAETDAAIAEWVRIVKPGGTLTIGAPNLGNIGRYISNDSIPGQGLLGVIYGDQQNAFWHNHQDGGVHMSGFTEASLVDAMARAGLVDIVPTQMGDLVLEVIGRKPKEET